MKIDFQHSSFVRVRYGETDQMGYCYYGNYAQYFEVGRVEALRSMGCSYKTLELEGVMLPVSEFSVKYFKPAYYDDELEIVTRITALKGPVLRFDYQIKNNEGLQIAAAHTNLVFVKKENMKPCAPPSRFVDLISKHHVQ